MKDFSSRLTKIRHKLDASRKISGAKGSYKDWLELNFPDFTWDAPHLMYAQSYIDKVIDGSIKRLMIFWPPRHGKSEMVTIRLPIYYLERNSNARVMMGAYNQDFANSFSRKTRKLARPIIDISNDRDTAAEWETKGGGSYMCAGIRSGVTGRGADLIILDDPIKNREEANSETFREKIWEEYKDSFYTRLEPNGAIILIMTRWHEDDLAGRILNSEDGGQWEVINLPALAEKDDPLGREIDAPLWKERFNYEALMDKKRVMGRSFPALYQQRPSVEEGEIIPVKMLQDYNDLPVFTHIVQSWDTAFKSGQENDYTVGTTWGVAKNGYYLLDRVKERMHMPELKRQIKQQAYKWDPNTVLIEDAASGQSAIQELQSLTRVPVIAIKVDSGKIARAEATADVVNSKRVFLPKFTPWKDDFVHALSIFPNGKHDDDVDSFAMAINYLTKRFSSSFSVYPGYNDDIHCVDDPSYKPAFVDFSVGLYIDSMCSAVLVGVTDTGNMIVMKEILSTTGIEQFITKTLKPYLKRVLKEAKPHFFVKSERKDSFWWEVLSDNKIDFVDLSNIETQAMIDTINELLGTLVSRNGAIQLLPKTCQDLREGFLGAYNYKARGNTSEVDYQQKPVINKYSRVHTALQVAIFDYRDYTDYIHEMVSGSDIAFVSDDDRSVISGY
jgi:predicted phage terminase large subunit-like protein